MMNRSKIIFTVILILFNGSVVAGEKKVGDKNKPAEIKELSGISIIGNKEAPKSLYIVPWKNSEVAVRTSLISGLLDESMKPVDKEVFMRELEFYELSHGSK